MDKERLLDMVAGNRNLEEQVFYKNGCRFRNRPTICEDGEGFLIMDGESPSSRIDAAGIFYFYDANTKRFDRVGELFQILRGCVAAFVGKEALVEVDRRAREFENTLPL